MNTYVKDQNNNKTKVNDFDIFVYSFPHFNNQ